MQPNKLTHREETNLHSGLVSLPTKRIVCNKIMMIPPSTENRDELIAQGSKFTLAIPT